MVETREYNPPPLIKRAHASRWIDKAAEPLRFAIGQIIPAECVSLFAGDGGSGKSILLQMAATCVATGRPFLGYAVEQGPALYITAEDPEAVLHLRQERINAALGLNMREASEQLYVLSAADLDFTLFSDCRPTDLESTLAQQIYDHQIKFLAIDSASLVFDDNEIDRRAVSAFLRGLNQLARKTGCTIVLIAHTSRSSERSAMRMASGSTAWVNCVRAGLQLTAIDNGAELTLLKSNYAKANVKVELYWTDEGVLMPVEQQVGMLAHLTQRRDDETVFNEIRTRWENEKLDPLSKSPRTRERYLPGFMARQGKLTRNRAESALTRLLDSGRIVSAPRTRKRAEGLKPAEKT